MASDISEELRAEVARRAGGRCEYCLIHELEVGFTHQVDHIVSRKHGGESTSDNLAYACVICNRYKGTDIAAIDQSSRQDRTALRSGDATVGAIISGLKVPRLNRFPVSVPQQ